DEEIAYTGRTGTTFTGLLRGQNGTVAAAHAATARVRGPFYKYSTRWAKDEARAKAAAIGDMQYANRLLLSDMLYLNVQRWGEDLQHVGLDLARGWLMYDGNGDLKKRVPLGFDVQQLAQFQFELTGAVAAVKARIRRQGNQWANWEPTGIVMQLGTAVSFYSHNPQKRIGHHFDRSRYQLMVDQHLTALPPCVFDAQQNPSSVCSDV